MNDLDRRQLLTCDVLVAGGGPAGLCAALSAARSGAAVILCQDRPVLGGNASSEVRMHIVGADCSGGRGVELATEAREGGLIEEIRLEAAVRNPQRSPSVFDLILYDLCRRQPNLRLMLNTTVTGAVVSERRIVQAFADRPSTEDRFAVEAGVYIDCTGDGRLGVEAGAAFRSGREARHEYGESLALETADNKRLGSTLLFQARRHDRPMPFVPPSWARRFTEHDLRWRPHASGELDLGLEYGYWWIEWGGELDTISDNEMIRDELLAILLGVWDHIKNGGAHGADHWALEWCGFLPGKRESRRFVGRYTLREQDVLGGAEFHDAIAYGGWHIDTHPPAGVDAVDEPPCTQHRVPHLYDIPLRACLSENLDNLLFAGRNISATHIAFASTRVMATCAAVGQGVGTAAAYSTAHGIAPCQLPDDAAAMQAIQQQLLRDDAYLIGRENASADDLARRATVSASSFLLGGEPQRAVSGPTRSVHGPRGAAPHRVTVGGHRWMSDPAQPLPQWLQLSWPEPVSPSRVQLIFDTGLHRPLTFSLADSYTALMHWGRAQPETVRDYRIEVNDSKSLSEGSWKTVVTIEGNYQRRCVHQLMATPIRGLRIVVTATNGLDHARICEVRLE